MDKIVISFLVPLEELIFGISFMTVFGILQLPYEEIGGAVITISLREGYPKVARHGRRLAVACMAAAGGILLWLVVPSYFTAAVAATLCRQFSA
ncbi:hypothetical protein Acr_00g0004670 [Actinidia rufa]|uniref:Uncharacterized protein n=1 Tax=Actinidia rufa TaxID=165716 RepID=A0A7J0D856_9ERIC|nr:hypothetical protein Acr_00g0004670 [Actinidia rufa]